MKTPFVKFQAVGNDFVLLDEREVGEREWSALALRMCDRHFGVGGDGLLVVSKSRVADFRYRMFNPDGTEDACGNGLRCVVKYWLESRAHGLKTGRARLRVEQRPGVTPASAILKNGVVRSVTASMGKASFDPKAIPLARDRELVDEELTMGGETFRMSCVLTGSVHTVIFVDRSPLHSPVPRISPTIETHPLFPERTNVMWTHVRTRSRLEVGIWERGAGETLGCGTGACAVAAVAHRLGLTGRKVRITSRGGQLQVERQPSGALLLTGEAVEVFRGLWEGQG
ncbi:MAG: diaminopimelate epimerase [Planctomycetes bacterium]|nr:diaminopimelate epimerase [Planctomycetota bacterium]